MATPEKLSMLAQTIGAALAAVEGPSTPKRGLHPKMAKHADAVKVAHQTLSQRPGFRKLSPAEQFRRTQAHIRRTR